MLLVRTSAPPISRRLQRHVWTFFSLASSVAAGEKMDNFIKGFRRHPDGSWECIVSSTLDGPNGRIQVTQGTRVSPGTLYMGVDLAEWLEREAERQRLLSSPSPESQPKSRLLAALHRLRTSVMSWQSRRTP